MHFILHWGHITGDKCCLSIKVIVFPIAYKNIQLNIIFKGLSLCKQQHTIFYTYFSIRHLAKCVIYGIFNLCVLIKKHI